MKISFALAIAVSIFLFNGLFAYAGLQEDIWQCEEEAETHSRPASDCAALKERLREILTHGSFEISFNKNVSESSSYGVQYLKFNENVSAVFKPHNPEAKGLTGRAIEWHLGDRSDKEIAAYIISEVFNFGVPVTVEREIDGVKGSLQAFAEDAFDGSTSWPPEDRNSKACISYVVFPGVQTQLARKVKHWISDREAIQYRRMKTLDYLIKNRDRYFRNWLYQEKTRRFIPIDHASCFCYKKDDGPHGIVSLEKIEQYLKNDTQLASDIRTVSIEDLRELLKPYLLKYELNHFLSRIQKIKVRLADN
jgi:hypothetical protein